MGADLRDEIESVLDGEAQAADTIDVIESPEGEVEQPEAEARASEEAKAEQQETSQEESEQSEAEQPLQPLNHWDHATREFFSSLTPAQQQGYMERDKYFSNRIRQATTEASQTRQLTQAFMQTMGPLVQTWQMRAIQPAQGLQMLVAREQAMRERPQELLLELANEYGVDLKQAFQDAPYVDPAVKKLQDELRSFKEGEQRRQNEAEQAQFQQQQHAQQQAYQAFESFTRETDESGALKYPYAADNDFMNRMAHAIETRQAATLEQAYTMVEQQLRDHPFFKAQLDAAVGKAAQQTQADVDKARQAAQTVEGDTSDTTRQPQSLRADIEDVLDEAGYR